MALHGEVHQRAHRLALGDVGAEEGRIAAALRDAGGHLLAARGVEGVDDDARAFLGQPPRDALADAAGRAGDNDGFACEPHEDTLLR